MHAGREDALTGNTKALRSHLYYPIVRRRHGPQLAPLFGEPTCQFPQFGEDTMADNLVEKLCRGALQLLVRDSTIHRDHLAADLFLADRSGFVAFITRASPAGDLPCHQPALDLPIEEIGARVTAPQGTVAVEDSD